MKNYIFLEFLREAKLHTLWCFIKKIFIFLLSNVSIFLQSFMRILLIIITNYVIIIKIEIFSLSDCAISKKKTVSCT